MQVLIAEDDPISRRFLEKILQNLGHDVTSCEDGLKAWEAYVGANYRVVISDWMMPEVDGLELCKRIRSTRKREYPYFIMLTARSSKADFLEAMDAGADDYLTKPLETDEIKVRLKVAERILERHRERNVNVVPAGVRFDQNIRRIV